MEQLEVLTPEMGSESRTGIQNSTGSRIRLVERRISKFEMQLQKMVIENILGSLEVSNGHWRSLQSIKCDFRYL